MERPSEVVITGSRPFYEIFGFRVYEIGMGSHPMGLPILRPLL
jgi:hypothetical protein